MNKKQLIVAFLMIILLLCISAITFVPWVEHTRSYYYAGTILIGGLLIYTLRDKKK